MMSPTKLIMALILVGLASALQKTPPLFSASQETPPHWIIYDKEAKPIRKFVPTKRIRSYSGFDGRMIFIYRCIAYTMPDCEEIPVDTSHLSIYSDGVPIGWYLTPPQGQANMESYEVDSGNDEFGTWGNGDGFYAYVDY